jgi:DNA-binding transcriptional LysR family regulator
MPNFRTLDLNLLRVFDAVMAEGSLTRAAQALAMTQPAVSHAVARLRESLGDELFQRAAHGVRPTPRAQALWPAVRQALSGLRHAIAPDSYEPGRDAVQWNLTMADATAALLVPPLVAAIEAGHARVNLRVLPLITRDPRRWLDAGEVDLAVGYFPQAVTAILAQGPDAALRQAPLYTSRYVCVMRRDHPLAGRLRQGAPLSLDDFCAAHHLLVSFSGRAHGFVDQALAAVGRQRRIVLTVNQFFTAGRVVSQSDLLTVLPERFIEAAGERDRLLTCALPLPLQPVHVAMLWHLRHDADPAHGWLRAQVQAAAAASTGAAAPG